MITYVHHSGRILLLLLFAHSVYADKRPVYIIGHMINEIRQVKHYLDRGANALESDIQFHPDGTVKEVYHGFPCDCFRTCTKSVGLPDYLRYVRKITDPNEPDSYFDKMVLQMLDLKISSSNNTRKSGREIARHILDYLWSDGSREQKVKVIVYIESIQNKDIIFGFVEEFKERGQENRLKNVGFDGGEDDLFAIRRFFTEMSDKVNVWQGDGKTNCISDIYPDGKLRRVIAIRDSRSNNYLSKVYHWTIDLKLRMRLSLNYGVDSFITNKPEDVVEVLQESDYNKDFRIATPHDNPFEVFRKK